MRSIPLFLTVLGLFTLGWSSATHADSALPACSAAAGGPPCTMSDLGKLCPGNTGMCVAASCMADGGPSETFFCEVLADERGVVESSGCAVAGRPPHATELALAALLGIGAARSASRQRARKRIVGR